MAIDSLLNPSADVQSSRPHLYASTTSQPQFSSSIPPSPTDQKYFYSYPNHNHHHRHNHTVSYSKKPTGTSHHAQPYSPYSYSPRSPRSPTTTDPYSTSSRSSRDRGDLGRDRHDSLSSSSSTNADGRRPPRPKYEEEEMFFIWYHRVDLGQEWKEVRESFNRQFPNRQRSGFQGIQCKFYRFIREKSCPTLREQRRLRDGEFLGEGAGGGGAGASMTSSSSSSSGSSAMQDSPAPRFGVVEWTGVWYPWMREDQKEVTRRRLA